jgi:hypothetical protein
VGGRGKKIGGMMKGERTREEDGGGGGGGGVIWKAREGVGWRKHRRKMRRRVGRIIGGGRTRGLEGGWDEVREEKEGRYGRLGRKAGRG